jgi:hypothetical protein
MRTHIVQTLQVEYDGEVTRMRCCVVDVDKQLVKFPHTWNKSNAMAACKHTRTNQTIKILSNYVKYEYAYWLRQDHLFQLPPIFWVSVLYKITCLCLFILKVPVGARKCTRHLYISIVFMFYSKKRRTPWSGEKYDFAIQLLNKYVDRWIITRRNLWQNSRKAGTGCTV